MSTLESNLFFFIDGESTENFTSPSDHSSGSPAYTYNSLYYASEPLHNGTHQFLLQNGQGDGGKMSLVLLDYLIYTR